MRKRLTYIAPLRAGIILGILYGIIALVIVPFFILASLVGGRAGMLGAVFSIFIPFVYAAVGFIGGVIAAALYNLIVKWTGGFEFEVRDVSPAAQPGSVNIA